MSDTVSRHIGDDDNFVEFDRDGIVSVYIGDTRDAGYIWHRGWEDESDLKESLTLVHWKHPALYDRLRGIYPDLHLPAGKELELARFDRELVTLREQKAAIERKIAVLAEKKFALIRDTNPADQCL